MDAGALEGQAVYAQPVARHVTNLCHEWEKLLIIDVFHLAVTV